MAKWCIRLDRSLCDDESWNIGCTDEWGNHHDCKGCQYNRYMGDGLAFTSTADLDSLY